MADNRGFTLSLEPKNIYVNVRVCLYQMHEKLMIVILPFPGPGLTQECIDHSF